MITEEDIKRVTKPLREVVDGRKAGTSTSPLQPKVPKKNYRYEALGWVRIAMEEGAPIRP